MVVNCSTQISDSANHSPALLHIFLSYDPAICSMMASPVENSDHGIVPSPIDFPSNSKGDALFHCTAFDHSHVDFAYWNDLCDHLRDVPWEDIFKLGASVSVAEFCGWVQVGINVYIPQPTY